jgi:hypothetical protein
MRRAIPPIPQYAFMAWCSVEAQGQLYFMLHVYPPSFFEFNTQRRERQIADLLLMHCSIFFCFFTKFKYPELDASSCEK